MNGLITRGTSHGQTFPATPGDFPLFFSDFWNKIVKMMQPGVAIGLNLNIIGFYVGASVRVFILKCVDTNIADTDTSYTANIDTSNTADINITEYKGSIDTDDRAFTAGTAGVEEKRGAARG